MPSRETEAPAESSPPFSETQCRILEYLRERVAEQTYFKSRLIAEELGLSSQEVGANMPAVRETAPVLQIEKWGYSSGTTWKVTVPDGD